MFVLYLNLLYVYLKPFFYQQGFFTSRFGNCDASSSCLATYQFKGCRFVLDYIKICFYFSHYHDNHYDLILFANTCLLVTYQNFYYVTPLLLKMSVFDRLVCNFLGKKQGCHFTWNPGKTWNLTI